MKLTIGRVLLWLLAGGVIGRAETIDPSARLPHNAPAPYCVAVTKEIVDLANLRFLSEHFNRPPLEIMERRAKAAEYPDLAAALAAPVKP